MIFVGSPLVGEELRRTHAVEVFAFEDVDEEDEHRQHQRPEDHAHESEQRQETRSSV